MSIHDRVEAAFITLMHKYLYSLIVNPTKMLIAAGLKEGNIVLEVGFGPGFFTFPAADIVGENGLVYAIEINPVFVKKVKRKVEKYSKKNIKVTLENVTKTSLDNYSVDVAFFFGIFHNMISILDQVVNEMYRILKPKGLMTIQKSRKNIDLYINQILKTDKFELLERKNQIVVLQKK